MLITFEGIDGSGKSTQIALLQKKLLEAGKTVNVFREPGGTAVSELIRKILLNPEVELNTVTELLLFSSARSQLVTEKVVPALNRDEIVILDRFYDSTTAYQGYGRNSLPIEQINQINLIASHALKPDITFYLRLSIEESNKRRADLSKDRMEQAGDEFFNNVIKGFDSLAENNKQFVTIEASQAIDYIHEQILERVLKNLR